jgi:hypothetical protein
VGAKRPVHGARFLPGKTFCLLVHLRFVDGHERRDAQKRDRERQRWDVELRAAACPSVRVAPGLFRLLTQETLGLRVEVDRSAEFTFECGGRGLQSDGLRTLVSPEKVFEL